MVPSFAAGEIKGFEQLISRKEDWSQQSQPPSLAPQGPAPPQWEGPGSPMSELGGQFGSWLTPCIFKHH